jgi:hypothetical protein
MTKKIISLCPHLQRFRKEAPIGLEDVLYAIRESVKPTEGKAISKLYKVGSKEAMVYQIWQLKTDYRKQPKEVKELVKRILNN